MPASWQLPPGVSRGLWDYLHDPAVAQSYDVQLEHTPLLQLDQQFVLDHCPLPGRFLDLGCGTGRLAIALAQRGHRVVAVDLSEEMLCRAAAKARAASVAIAPVKANLVELDCIADASFDAAACLFSTLGMIAGAAARRRFLAHVHRLLRPGGVFIVHVHNRWFHLWTSAGRRLLWSNLRQACLGRETLGDFVMPGHQGLGEFPMHLFSRREIARLLSQVGFTVMEMRALSIAGYLRWPWLCHGLRSYGYLIAATASGGR
jgi:SAM-dependent methyltransferase